MTALTFVVLALASYRITRLVVTDTLWSDTRDRMQVWLAERSDDHLWAEKLLELSSCPFCAGVWVTAAVLTFASLFDVVDLRWPVMVIDVAAVAGAQALLSALDARLEG